MLFLCALVFLPACHGTYKPKTSLQEIQLVLNDNASCQDVLQLFKFQSQAFHALNFLVGMRPIALDVLTPKNMDPQNTQLYSVRSNYHDNITHLALCTTGTPNQLAFILLSDNSHPPKIEDTLVFTADGKPLPDPKAPAHAYSDELPVQETDDEFVVTPSPGLEYHIPKNADGRPDCKAMTVKSVPSYHNLSEAVDSHDTVEPE
jgi:hypothetical protein